MQTSSLLKYMEKQQKMRISRIVADFIKDSEGNVWFIDLKSFSYEETLPKYPNLSFELTNLLQNVSSSKQFSQPIIQHNSIKKDEVLGKITTLSKCRMCKIYYAKNQLNKGITNKMLIDFVDSLEQRGIYRFSDLKVCIYIIYIYIYIEINRNPTNL